MAQDGADGLGDVGRRKHGQRHLVEQRLKSVVVAAVDDSDVDGQMREPLGRVQAGESAADDDDAGPASFCILGFWRRAAHGQHLYQGDAPRGRRVADCGESRCEMWDGRARFQPLVASFQLS